MLNQLKVKSIIKSIKDMLNQINQLTQITTSENYISSGEKYYHFNARNMTSFQ